MRMGSRSGGVLRAAIELLLLLCLLASCGEATGYLDWQKCLGGSNLDYARSVQQTADGGYVVAGRTLSNDGDVSGNHGKFDYWVVKLDGLGNIIWQKCLGGSSTDYAYSVQQTADGGYIVAGYTSSNDGNVTNGGYHGANDYWVVKLDGSGNKIWQKCLGGSGWDRAYSIQQADDGGYVVAGCAHTNNMFDYYVVKLNGSGNLIWQKYLGGGNGEKAYSVQQTADGGYVVAGFTDSKNGDVSGSHGVDDYWVVKLNESGNLVWQKCLGGGYSDQAYSIQQTADCGYVVAGFANSNDGDVIGNHGSPVYPGSPDYWIVKLGEIDCTITATDAVYSGSADNAASTAESGASYAWSITNGAITSPSYAQSISFTAGTSGTTRLTVDVSRPGFWEECYKDIAIKPKPNSSRIPDQSISDSLVQLNESGMESHERDSGDGQASSPVNRVRIYPG